MNIGNIITPNIKGQIVIPQRLRKALGITKNTPLQLIQSGKSLIISPIKNVVRYVDQEESYLDILKKTAGSWAGDDWPETEKRRKKIDTKAAKRRKAISW